MSFPAAGALVVETVPKPLLQRANASMGSATGTANLIGLVAGAGLIATVGPGWGLAIDAGSFAVTAVLFSRLDLSGRLPASGSMTDDLREGWRAFVVQPWLWTTVLGFLVINATYSGTVAVLGPAIADDNFGRARWGWILACQAIGMLGATASLSRFDRPLRLWPGLVFAALVAPWILFLGISPTVPILLATAVLAGVGLGYFDIAWDTNLQANVSGEHLSRVYSFDMMGSILALPVGQIMIGPIAETFGRRSTLMGAALLIVLACAAVLAAPAVRNLPAPELET